MRLTCFLKQYQLKDCHMNLSIFVNQNLARAYVFIFFFSITTFSFSACKNTENPPEGIKPQFASEQSLALSNTDIYVAASIETCDCMQPMFELVASINDSEQKQLSKSLINQEARLEAIRPQIEACGEAIRKKYGEMKSAREQAKILEALKKYCPESFEILNKGILVKSDKK
jgi:hypothetical protein